MKVRDIMTTDVATATPETTLEDVASMMRDEDTGAIPVLNDDELVGIITDRDIVIRCIAEGKDPVETTVDDVLTEGLETIEPDADITEARELMSRRQVRRLPVVEEGNFVGILSIGDIAVKSNADVGDTLENVSEGVKTSGGTAKRAGAGKNRNSGNGSADSEVESGRKANARAGREGGTHAGSGSGNQQAGRGNQQAGRANGGRNQNQVSGGNRKQNESAGNRKQNQSAGKSNRNQEQLSRKNVAGRRVEAKGGTRRRAS